MPTFPFSLQNFPRDQGSTEQGLLFIWRKQTQAKHKTEFFNNSHKNKFMGLMKDLTFNFNKSFPYIIISLEYFY